ncbi:MAG TPA: DinB family protein [Gemmatimonadaceae bacterium]|nr:DinB family protein [Gemmatimonadaceae bacterium]
MPQARLLSKLFEMNYGALYRNLEGITHEDSLVLPQPGGNPLNWVVGHIVATRNRMFGVLKLELIWPNDIALQYSGLDEWGWSPETALDLKSIEADLARSQSVLMSALDAITSRDLNIRSEDGRTLAEVLGFFHFHEAYHVGQAGLLRRILGRQGVIKPPRAGAPRLSPSDTRLLGD